MDSDKHSNTYSFQHSN
jgi:hypothetical protein